MISTPVDSFNFYTTLLNLRDPDTQQRMFLVFEVEMICGRCAKKAKSEQCRHNLRFLPPWKSTQKKDLVAQIMKDNISILKRESL